MLTCARRSLPYLGAAVAEIVTLPPSQIKDQTYSVNQFWPTGNDIIELFTRLNGSKPEIKDFTPEDAAALKEQAPIGFVAAALKDAWTAGNWVDQGDFKVDGWNGPSLEEIAAKST